MTTSVSGSPLRLLGLALGCILATGASATNRYYDCTTGNLLTASCWSGNVRPGVNDAAFIGDTGYGFDVTATLSAASPAFTPQYEWIAYAGHNGTVNQSAGTNGSPTATYLISVGYGAGLTGTYNLSGTGTLNAGNTLEVGTNGTGIFNQTGGTSIVPTYLYLGTNATGNGSYNLQGGTLDADSTMVSTQEIIGFYGTGSFTQTGGTHNANTISMATGAGSLGSYSLSGTGTLAADYVGVGSQGDATFTHSASTATIGNLYVRAYSGGSGTYNLSGTGSLTSSFQYFGNTGGTNSFNQSGGSNTVFLEYLGYTGPATYLQTGGTHTVTGVLDMANQAGGAGTYDLRGGSLNVSAGGITDGAGTSTLNVDGGTLSVGGGNGSIAVDNLVLGSALGFSGSHTLSGTGSIAAGNATIGDSGAGNFTQTGGTNTIAAILAIAANAGSSGTYSLQGGALSAGSITNKGTLNFSAGTLAGAIDNTGNLNLSGGGTRTLNDAVLNNGTVDVAGGTSATFNGLFSGAGAITGGGTSTFNGGFNPGNSPAEVNIAGDAVLGAANTLQIELAGLTAGSQYDRVNVAGDAWLDGTLDIDFYGGFNPVAGNSFDIIFASVLHGSFGTTLLPNLDPGLLWDLQYLLNPTSTDVVRLSVVAAVPVPAAAWLFGAALGLLGWMKRRTN